MGGKKPKHGMLTGGYGTITIGNGGKFGIKSKKCLKMGNCDIQSVRGEFINDNIEVIVLPSITKDKRISLYYLLWYII